MDIPQKHQLKIARQTMRLTCTGARIMGGMDHREAARVIHRLTGKHTHRDPDCTCFARQGVDDAPACCR